VAELYPFIIEGCRAMVFVDGENLAIRYGAMLDGRAPQPGLIGWYRPDVAVWAQDLSPNLRIHSGTRVLRKYYYTSVQGDADKIDETTDWLKSRGFESPRVFKKYKERGSKQVDISLATDMLTHASRRHYDIAVLVAGDEDYVPLVRAVKAEGPRVHIWFVTNGLSPVLRREADHFVNLDGHFGL
jgi:uncharacterized LabA/DUF88 family protein